MSVPGSALAGELTATGATRPAHALWWVALFAVVGAFAGTRAGGAAPAPVVLEPFLQEDAGTAANVDAAASGSAGPPSTPVELAIPDIGVRAAVRPVGLNPDGSLDTPPPADAGWYRLGPPPGARGSAVIAGHVDTRRAAAVFADLADVARGQLLGVRDETGVWTIFRVGAISRHGKEALPRELWAPTRQRLLRLITCGGPFDARTGHYEQNVVVHAEALGRWRPPASDPSAEPPWRHIAAKR